MLSINRQKQATKARSRLSRRRALFSRPLSPHPSYVRTQACGQRQKLLEINHHHRQMRGGVLSPPRAKLFGRGGMQLGSFCCLHTALSRSTMRVSTNAATPALETTALEGGYVFVWSVRRSSMDETEGGVFVCV